MAVSSWQAGGSSSDSSSNDDDLRVALVVSLRVLAALQMTATFGNQSCGDDNVVEFRLWKRRGGLQRRVLGARRRPGRQRRRQVVLLLRRDAGTRVWPPPFRYDGPQKRLTVRETWACDADAGNGTAVFEAHGDRGTAADLQRRRVRRRATAPVCAARWEGRDDGHGDHCRGHSGGGTPMGYIYAFTHAETEIRRGENTLSRTPNLRGGLTQKGNTAETQSTPAAVFGQHRGTRESDARAREILTPFLLLDQGSTDTGHSRVSYIVYCSRICISVYMPASYARLGPKQATKQAKHALLNPRWCNGTTARCRPGRARAPSARRSGPGRPARRAMVLRRAFFAPAPCRHEQGEDEGHSVRGHVSPNIAPLGLRGTRDALVGGGGG